MTKPAICRDGVSRLSAHLHFGMVSPFRVARDALAAPSFGAGKFVDEYLTWREVAYAFCFHHCSDLDSLRVRGRSQPLSEWAILVSLLAMIYDGEWLAGPAVAPVPASPTA